MATFIGSLARIARTFRLELGPLEARGAPAVILAVGGVVIARGVARLIAENPQALAETIREATRFMGMVRGDTSVSLQKPK